MVFATVETIQIDDAVITGDGRLDIKKIEPLARMGYFDYTVVRETFEMRVPRVEQDAQSGRGGQAA